MKEIEITVKGMVCEGCEKRVENALKNRKEIKKVTASHQEGKVTILLKKEIPEETIKQTIQDIGFEVI